MALPAWQLSGTFPAAVACGFPLVTAGFCLWASALHPSFFFLPWRHLARRFRCLLSFCHSYRRFGAASASFCSHAAHSAASGAQCIAKLSCRHRHCRCHSTAPASTARLHAHPVLYAADKKGQLFTASTAASRDMAARDLVLGGPATWVRQPTYVARGYPHQSQETAHANEDWCLHQAQRCR